MRAPRGAVSIRGVAGEYWILSGIMLLGLILRLRHLGDSCLWMDEVFQARAALRPTFWEAVQATPPNKPPLFYIVEWLVALPSISEWWLRVPSCIAGVVGIWGIWRLTRAIFADRAVALLAAGLLAVSPLHIAFSQEARGYATSMLFSMLGVAAMFIELNREENLPRTRNIVLLALWPALSCWTSYFGLGILALQLLWAAALLFLARRHPYNWPRGFADRATGVLWGLLLSLVLLLPLFYRVPTQSTALSGPPDPRSLGLGDLGPRFFANLAGWFSAGTEVSIVWPVALLFLPIALLGLLVSAWRKPAAATFLFLWVVILQIAQILLYLNHGHWISSRYHLLYLTPYLVCVALGMVTVLRFANLKPSNAGVVLTMSVVVLGFVAMRPVRASVNYKSNIREVVHKISQQASSRDVVVVSRFPAAIVYDFYRDTTYPNAPLSTDLGLMNLPTLISRIDNADRIWFVAARTYCEEFPLFLKRVAPRVPDLYPRDNPAIICASAAGATNVLLSLESKADEWRAMKVRPPFVVEMGSPKSSRHLCDAWIGPVQGGDVRYRFLEGRDGALCFNMPVGSPTTVTVVAQSVPTSQALTVCWDGIVIGTHQLRADGFTTMTFTILPGQNRRGDQHLLRLKCAHSQRAAVVDDGREQMHDLSLMATRIVVR